LGSPKQNELTLQNLLDIFWKRRRVVYGAALAPGDPGCAVNTRRYEATCTVQIEKESSDRLGLDILMNEATIDPMRFKPTTLSMFHSAI
jgi:uncharacterized protein involved in exopolysaccharide biosynthesis